MSQFQRWWDLCGSWGSLHAPTLLTPRFSLSTRVCKASNTSIHHPHEPAAPGLLQHISFRLDGDTMATNGPSPGRRPTNAIPNLAGTPTSLHPHGHFCPPLTGCMSPGGDWKFLCSCPHCRAGPRQATSLPLVSAPVPPESTFSLQGSLPQGSSLGCSALSCGAKGKQSQGGLGAALSWSLGP